MAKCLFSNGTGESVPKTTIIKVYGAAEETITLGSYTCLTDKNGEAELEVNNADLGESFTPTCSVSGWNTSVTISSEVVCMPTKNKMVYWYGAYYNNYPQFKIKAFVNNVTLSHYTNYILILAIGGSSSSTRNAWATISNDASINAGNVSYIAKSTNTNSNYKHFELGASEYGSSLVYNSLPTYYYNFSETTKTQKSIEYLLSTPLMLHGRIGCAMGTTTNAYLYACWYE